MFKIKQDKEKRCLGPGKTACFIPQFIFNASACKHDNYYKEGGGIIEKVKADTFFYAYMLDDISKGSACHSNSKQGNFSFIRRMFYFKMATIYFIMVSIFGVFCFNWKFK